MNPKRTRGGKKVKHIKRIEGIVKKGLGCCDLFNFDFEIVRLLEAGIRDFAKKTASWPGSDDFPTFESWQKYLLEIAADLKVYIDYDYKDLKDEDKVKRKAWNAVRRFAKVWPHLWM